MFAVRPSSSCQLSDRVLPGRESQASDPPDDCRQLSSRLRFEARLLRGSHLTPRLAALQRFSAQPRCCRLRRRASESSQTQVPRGGGGRGKGGRDGYVRWGRRARHKFFGFVLFFPFVEKRCSGRGGAGRGGAGRGGAGYAKGMLGVMGKLVSEQVLFTGVCTRSGPTPE